MPFDKQACKEVERSYFKLVLRFLKEIRRTSLAECMYVCEFFCQTCFCWKKCNLYVLFCINVMWDISLIPSEVSKNKTTVIVLPLFKGKIMEEKSHKIFLYRKNAHNFYFPVYGVSRIFFKRSNKDKECTFPPLQKKTPQKVFWKISDSGIIYSP